MAKVTHNASNERLKRRYFSYLKEARRRSDASIDGVAKDIVRFEEYTGFRDFRQFHREQAVGFKRKLDEQSNQKSGVPLSRATVHSILRNLRSFFIWLANEAGFKSRISFSDADYFNLSEKDVRIANAHREGKSPTLEQIHRVLMAMPAHTDLEMRDRAVVSFVAASGIRDGALISLKLKHLDLHEGRVDQDAREVKTKFSKTFSTWFFPVGGEALKIVREWAGYLENSLGWSGSDPLFPSTRMGLGPDGALGPMGLEKAHWSTAEPVRRIFKAAFALEGLPYFAPHSFRKTLVRLGEQICQSPESFKAWSQNLGHEGVLTTFTSYGAVSPERQAQIIRSIGTRESGAGSLSPEEVVARVAALVAASGTQS